MMFVVLQVRAKGFQTVIATSKELQLALRLAENKSICTNWLASTRSRLKHDKTELNDKKHRL